MLGLARSVPKPLKVPSVARSMPKPLKVPSVACSVPKLVKVPSRARSVPKPRLIVPRCQPPPPAVKEQSDWSSTARYEYRLFKVNRQQRGTNTDFPKLTVGSERVPTPKS